MENIYQTPNSSVERKRSGFVKPAFFSWSGRIGRLRFLAYSSALIPLMIFIFSVFAFLMSKLDFRAPQDYVKIAILSVSFIYVPIVLFLAFLGSRRFRDLNYPAGLSLLITLPYLGFIPLLICLLKAGEENENRHGLPPAPNTLGVMIGAFLGGLVFLVGIVANINAITRY